MLIALLQFFTKEYNKDATNDFKQLARFACSACLITSLFALIYVFVSLLIGFKPGIYVMLFDTIALLGLALLFKTKTNLNLISNLYIIFCFLPVLLCSFFSGGIDSPVTPWFIIVPMTASLMMNKKIIKYKTDMDKSVILENLEERRFIRNTDESNFINLDD